MTVSLLRCAVCSVCCDVPLKSPDHADLLGNYLTEIQISYCLDVSYLRMCQIPLRQQGITNNTGLRKAPAFFMSCVLPGRRTGSGKRTGFYTVAGLHWSTFTLVREVSWLSSPLMAWCSQTAPEPSTKDEQSDICPSGNLLCSGTSKVLLTL